MSIKQDNMRLTDMSINGESPSYFDPRADQDAWEPEDYEGPGVAYAIVWGIVWVLVAAAAVGSVYAFLHAKGVL